MAESRLLIQDFAGVCVVTFTDSSILDSATIDQLGKDLYHLTDDLNKQKMIIDFNNVKFLSSQVLGILITLNKKSAAIKGTLVLCSLKPDLMKVFTITSLDKLFKFFPNDVAALKHFGVNLGPSR
jgi:anti-sigma B factor antagonist